MQQLHLIGKGHIMNPFWDGRVARRKRRYKATYDAAMGYLRRYAPAVERIVPESTDSRKEPERAFTIWLQGENKAPELVKACFRSMRRNLTQELVVLDETTLYDWITLPEHIVAKWKEGKIPHAHFSDICRIELLYKHGGLWFDATDYVTAPVPQYIMDQDLFLFMAGNKIRLVDIIRGFNRMVTKTQMGYSNAASLFGVILEICLDIFVSMVADNLDGVFVCANGAVTAKTPELAFGSAFCRGVRGGLFFQRHIGHVVDNADGKLCLGLIFCQLFINRKDRSRWGILRT